MRPAPELRADAPAGVEAQPEQRGPARETFGSDTGNLDIRDRDAFIERLIVPQASAVWSADPAQMWSFPASFMVEFFENHGMYSLRNRPRWRTVSGGSRSYVEAITAPWRDRVRTGSPVRRIERLPDRVRIEVDGCESEEFDQVVIATHSDQALKLLGDPSEREHELLGAIPYQPNEAVLHTDASLLPRRRRAWASTR